MIEYKLIRCSDDMYHEDKKDFPNKFTRSL